ncbi:hypothetical protein OGAPHI_003406 [Ogataea philodendri]|uniref:Uncharacterized protein n=1 Tax=Ogataea philodendri TaxID=1378263 RepID=A0A9P8P8B0_9ASCO|nr:uncharacterized protein OGAPHI_003406 [Ogataea philodendri]KAH3666956.1 hypothetical protein OGAPHI_003406 [Ogataea philodendri]
MTESYDRWPKYRSSTNITAVEIHDDPNASIDSNEPVPDLVRSKHVLDRFTLARKLFAAARNSWLAPSRRKEAPNGRSADGATRAEMAVFDSISCSSELPVAMSTSSFNRSL